MKEIVEIGYIKNELSPSWFIEKPIDFEYKVYQLMAFLKNCGDNVHNGYWFPDFEIIEKRYKDIESFKESSEINFMPINMIRSYLITSMIYLITPMSMLK